MLWVFCMICGHAMRETPVLFIKRLGEAPALEEAAKKLRCRRCGKRDGMLIPSREQMPEDRYGR